MSSESLPALLETALGILGAAGFPLASSQRDVLLRHAALVSQATRLLHLVSQRDAEQVLEVHTLDALRLVPLVGILPDGAGCLDIGSGGGFPGIPLAIAFPGVRVTLMERNDRKVGFLTRCVAQLGLKNVRVVQDQFPPQQALPPVALVTARAVETPEKVLPKILERLEIGSRFVCQSPIETVLGAKMFHVEQFAEGMVVKVRGQVKLFHVEQFGDIFAGVAPSRAKMWVIGRVE